uniref:3-deoxy-7-phosphoheptulonate synthase n=1 Tax=viral metagenome TaxID=1070528 RepID=A0A6C0J528_9ZZZZ
MSDSNIIGYTLLPSPYDIITKQVLSTELKNFIKKSRETISNIIFGKDKRKLLIIGPCSIHDVKAATEYAKLLSSIQRLYNDKIFIVMRTYFEKPRTIVGWKGLLYDPECNGSNKIVLGINTVRHLLTEINKIGVPCACEFLDPNMPQYYADLISWGAIGARTTESQIHRQLASGLSCPIGFKNSTSGSVKYPMNSVLSCAQPHTFPGIDYNGHACIINTRGNPSCHIILRGSDSGPNYQSLDNIYKTVKDMDGIHRGIVIDCAHGNSNKNQLQQQRVWEKINNNYINNDGCVGLMIESFLKSGRVDLEFSNTEDNYGRSVTDECISWNMTQERIAHMYNSIILT